MGPVYGVGRRRIIWIVAGVLFAAVTVWVHYEVKVRLSPGGSGSGVSLEQSGRLRVGEEIAGFAAIDLEGAEISLSDFQDREVVVLDFWATWCQPCVQGMPSFQVLNDEFDGRGAEFLAVNMGEETEIVREFMDYSGFSFRVVMDQEEEISALYGLRGIPQLVVIGADGRVEHIEVGFPARESAAEARTQRLRKLLEELTAENASGLSGAG